MFQEKRLVSKITTIGKPYELTRVLNPPDKAQKFSLDRIEAAAREFIKPVSAIAGGVRGMVSAVLLDLPKKAVQEAGSTVSKVATGAIAFPVNVVRGVADVALKGPLTAALGLASVIPEKTLGMVSRTARRINEKVHEVIGKPLEPVEDTSEALPLAA